MPYVTVAPELVASLVATHPATREELHAIRDPHNPTRFRGVYGHRHGGIKRGNSRYVINAYRARVFKFFELGSGFASPEAAARAVVAFYKNAYGERWRHLFNHSKVTPWRLRTVKRHGLTGYAIDVYVRGIAVRVTRADVSGRAPGASELDLWATAVEAKLAARVAMRKWFERERRALSIPAPNLLFWRA